MKKMAVIRGTEARPSQVYFYNYFKKLEIKFIGHKIKKSFYPPRKIAKIKYIQSPLKPAWLIDPARLIYKKVEHHAWSYHQDLEKYIQDCEILNLTDCFYFFCGQTARLAKKYHKPLVTIVWESFPKHPSTYIPPYCFNVRAVLRESRLFIARHRKAGIYLRSIGVPDKKIRVIYKGVDLKHFYPAEKRIGRKVKILYIGQLAKVKGVDDLLAAFEKVCRQEKGVELLIGGNGSLKDLVLNYAKRLPIRYLGFVSYPDLPGIYREADIFCSPSKDFLYFGFLPGGEEWFSYTLMEAMASGLPLVANRGGAVEEEVGKEGFLLEQNDVEGLAETLLKLVRNEGLRRKMGRGSRLRAEEVFNAQKQAVKTEKAILEIID
ncbi:MAG: glycosyltransferase family 4 protein [Candidatus Pacebacteria bacterium]|nr:glycosyltransferase family 4 protein [Candidatus Paceibacterota bacterium]